MFKKFIFGFLFLSLFSGFAVAQEKLEVKLFYSPYCFHCLKLKTEYLPKLKEKYQDKVIFTQLDITNYENSFLLDKLARANGEEASVPAMLVEDTFLIGYPSTIKPTAEQVIDTALMQAKFEAFKAGTLEEEPVADVQDTFAAITLSAIVFNGLIDGINPCAFAVIVFFISFLSAYGYRKREVFYIGSAYCFAVFLTYILLGFGFFKALYALNSFVVLIKVFYYLTAGICFSFFALSIRDIIVYKKTGNAGEMLLQLPKSFKHRINKIVGFFLRGKDGEHKSAFGLILASLVVGFLVSLIEAICTGQVYVPTIVLILKQEAFRVKAWAYLLLYNLMFIMPLVLIFMLSLMGYSSDKFSGFLKKNLVGVKVLLAIVFLALGLMLLFG
ncbi:MAG: hypothetical protein HN833_04005 [Elusimicrobiaceae bacterium]|jgi:hypothetical protein|nr:hypothetical protein [Elusimicrobiaceae bacterium]MBT3955353.1 hypothetical protein [Elusimicrobiaceae bacterium]MBT4008489.1 hypothetical protein [Elusimicrobiaceae bacterium]MBT4403377.1 hypothetical protein [Elusimicrobiaceae bacterium]MBT4440218.1 hypothetical protein [Elusimicrobiaceae bacterium]